MAEMDSKQPPCLGVSMARYLGHWISSTPKPVFSVKWTQPTQPTQPLEKNATAARSTNTDPTPLETKSPPASPWEKQSPSTIKGPQSPLFNCRGPLAKNHVKKCRKESSSGEESLQITCRGQEPADRSARPSHILLPWRLQNQPYCPALPGQPPSQQPSRRLQALSLQPSGGVVPKM